MRQGFRLQFTDSIHAYLEKLSTWLEKSINLSIYQSSISSIEWDFIIPNMHIKSAYNAP